MVKLFDLSFFDKFSLNFVRSFSKKQAKRYNCTGDSLAEKTAISWLLLKLHGVRGRIISKLIQSKLISQNLFHQFEQLD